MLTLVTRVDLTLMCNMYGIHVIYTYIIGRFGVQSSGIHPTGVWASANSLTAMTATAYLSGDRAVL